LFSVTTTGSPQPDTPTTEAARKCPMDLDRPVVARKLLPQRRASTSFSFQCAGLAYTATFSRFDDGRVGELFLNNHKSNSAADVNARDGAIAISFALQFGADLETIRKALCRDGQGGASGPLAKALDLIEGPAP
jgi:hypothetical protein